jgi:hypothetical protein
MNTQFLQLIQKVQALEGQHNSYKLKIKELETQLNTLRYNERRPYSEFLPLGSILLFAGEKIPMGWSICDGKNGTPVLNLPEADSDKGVYIMKT